MRIVVISDLHFDVCTIGVPRFEEVRAAVAASVQHAIATRADAWACLGDIADPDNGGASLRAIEQTIETALELADERIPSIWIAGNHCCMEDGSGATLLSPLAAVARSAYAGDYVHVAERPLLVSLPSEVVVLCLPYAPTSHAYDPAAETRRLLEVVPRTTRIVVASHLTGVPGIIPGEEVTEMPRGRSVLFPFEETRRAFVRLSGHFHRRQIFDPSDGGPPLHVVGAAARLTFAEQDHEPGFVVVDVPDAP